MSEFITSRCSYFSHAFLPEAEIVFQATEHLAAVDFDTFVGTGLSGGLVVPLLGRAMDKQWMIVRKPGENPHSGQEAEGTLGRRWLFVDDLIDTGATFDRVSLAVKKVAREHSFDTIYAGDYLYNHGGEFRPVA